MVSLRRFTVSTLWTIRNTKWLSVVVVLIAVYTVVLVLQAGLGLFKTRLRELPQETLSLSVSAPLNVQLPRGIDRINYNPVEYSHSRQGSNLVPKIRGQNLQSDQLTGADSQNVDNKAARNTHRQKYLFVFRYYEQLGRATNNLLELASWAKHRNSIVVAPFVNNSRMSGLPGGVSHYLRTTTSLARFGPLREYFDVKYLNNLLKKRGYGTLGGFGDFQNDCQQRLNIVIHFLYSNREALLDAAEWYRKTYREMKEIYTKTRANGGWLPCPFVRYSRLQKQLNFKVSRYVCVDPEMIQDAFELERKVIQGRFCVGVVLWKGNGKGRVHFPLHPSITRPLTPPDVRFNATLVEIARKFVEERLGGSYIAVHVRGERHLVRKGTNITYRCVRKLIDRVREAQRKYHIQTVFLATDLPEYGSDTFDQERGSRKALQRYLHKELNQPVSYQPADLYDNGAIAIIEMNILAAGNRLFTLGSGNFQNWIVSLFLQRRKSNSKKLHRLCELS
ncbi:uncharacterized protein LOC116619277 [Nematostella vectensis]|uniref:uncharacterized protein LOC116619277 n=1 Tax=Nematostella vectensis TaxID=45351 RepID=UPI00207774EE|nr:uncharacterized protein LOC116619277 [Nematostella vectensis]